MLRHSLSVYFKLSAVIIPLVLKGLLQLVIDESHFKGLGEYYGIVSDSALCMCFFPLCCRAKLACHLTSVLQGYFKLHLSYCVHL